VRKLGASGLPTAFLPGDRQPVRPGDWVVRWLAALCVVALTVGLVHLVHNRTQPVDPVAVAAEGFADGQAAAFAGSASAGPTAMSAQDRAAGLPGEAVAGLSWTTTAGPMRLVLPGGLGPAQSTRGGQVVYPDAGAGFDFLAENTPTGTRTVARINSPAGVRAVTTFLRTTVDVVMLAHTNGYLTLNRTEPSAETVAMFAPSEARDANGQLVPSSYVVRQYGIGLYQLSEVIAPTETTAWPVYVDPPLDLTGPLPQFDFSSITDTISGAAASVAGAATSAASAVASGASAVGTFVKNNPLESAMLVGGVALSLTGVGGPAGAAVIAAAAVNVSSTVVDVVAAHNPDNAFLGDLSTVLSAASMITPQGGAKKIVGEGLEVAITQAERHADDIAEAVVDVAKAVPTPPTQLAQDVANSAMAKIPNAPPSALPVPRVAAKFPPTLRKAAYNDAIAPDGNLYCTYCGSRIYIQEGRTLRGDTIPPNRAQLDHYLAVKHGGDGSPENLRLSCMACNGMSGKGDMTPQQFEAAKGDIADRSRQVIADYEAQHGTQPDGVIRTPNDRSPLPAADEQQANSAAADQQRNTALENARNNNNSSTDRSANDQNSQPGYRPSQQKDQKDDKKSKMHHPKPTGN